MSFGFLRDFQKQQQQSLNLKYKFRTVGEVSNNYFISDDTWLLYRNVIDMLLPTDKLNVKCYVLYETKELLTVTKMYITIISVLMFIISIVIVLIIIITLIIISIFILFVKSAWQIC